MAVSDNFFLKFSQNFLSKARLKNGVLFTRRALGPPLHRQTQAFAYNFVYWVYEEAQSSAKEICSFCYYVNSMTQGSGQNIYESLLRIMHY